MSVSPCLLATDCPPSLGRCVPAAQGSLAELAAAVGPTAFTGYERLEGTASVRALLVDGRPAERAAAGAQGLFGGRGGGGGGCAHLLLPLQRVLDCPTPLPVPRGWLWGVGDRGLSMGDSSTTWARLDLPTILPFPHPSTLSSITSGTSVEVVLDATPFYAESGGQVRPGAWGRRPRLARSPRDMVLAFLGPTPSHQR
jgi:hypothetical protein